jgi:hypothetical protein
MMPPSHDPATPAGRLALAVERARESFHGRTWDTGPSTLFGLVDDHPLPEIDDDRIDAIKQLGRWWGTDASTTALDARWDRVLVALPKAIDRLASLFAEVEALANVEDAAIDESADRAGEHGERAVMFAESSDWPAVLVELEAACSLERDYGDAPAWGPVLELARDMAQAAEAP